ncbi:MAG: polyprenyl synthetase family protein [Clostridiaceae bacterium]|nr:polyprenyl synthetase family protein [Clostridiaceae bacterium]
MERIERLESYAATVLTALERFLPASDDSRAHIRDAMRYSLLSPGKRIRPALTLEFCRVCGGTIDAALPFACALEMIHCYSLIHDDLPCMDNDTLRRGRPTNHVVYGEDFAVLAGDGLLTHAFVTALSSGLPSEHTLAAARALAAAAGIDGMLGGQAIDVQNDGKLSSFDELSEMYDLKTGALMRVAAKLGCIAAGAGESELAAADRYAASVGLAFQIRDDLLDLEQDEAIGKTTYPAILGESASCARIDELTREAIAAARSFADSDFLTWLALYLAGRDI